VVYTGHWFTIHRAHVSSQRSPWRPSEAPASMVEMDYTHGELPQKDKMDPGSPIRTGFQKLIKKTANEKKFLVLGSIYSSFNHTCYVTTTVYVFFCFII
jgi:hypothetical protein